MGPLRSLALGLAAALVAVPATVSAEVYRYNGTRGDEFVISDPFNSAAMGSLSVLSNGARIPAGGSDILSIGYSFDKKFEQRPGEQQPSFIYRRTTRFQAGKILAEFDRIAGSMEGNGCSRLRIDPARMISRSAHQLKVRLKFTYTKRTCSWAGTHDVGEAKGEAIYAVELYEGNFNPKIRVRELSHDVSASVLGISDNNFFGNLALRFTQAIDWMIGNPARLGLGLGGFEFAMLRPVNQITIDQVLTDPSRFFSPDQISAIRTAYGSLAAYLGHDDARRMSFEFEASGFRALPGYRAKAGFADKISSGMCTALQGNGNSAQYCQRTGSDSLVIEMVERARRFEDTYSYHAWVVDQEMRYLDSMDDPVQTVTFPENVIMTNISDQFYGPRHHDFFMANNAQSDCFQDTLQTRRVCNFKIEPLWLEKPRDNGAGNQHPLAPGGPLAAAMADAKTLEFADN